LNRSYPAHSIRPARVVDKSGRADTAKHMSHRHDQDAGHVSSPIQNFSTNFVDLAPTWRKTGILGSGQANRTGPEHFWTLPRLEGARWPRAVSHGGRRR